jgi:ABC-type proline/glycine betaine transport system permease subunit
MNRFAILALVLVAVTLFVVWVAGSALQMPESQAGSAGLVYNIILAVALLTSLVLGWRGSFSEAIRSALIWFAAFVPSVINAFSGVRAIDRPIIEAARMLGTPPLRMVVEVIAPAAMPMIFTGLRLSLQAAWTTLVAAELVGAYRCIARGGGGTCDEVAQLIATNARRSRDLACGLE